MYGYSRARSAPAHVALISTLVFAGGCAITTRPSIEQRVDRSVIAQDEVPYASAETAYDIVEHLRPEFLIAMAGRSLAAERLVYINGVRAGGLEVLNDIPAGRVQEIRL